MNTAKKKLENEDGWSKYITICNTEAENLKNNNRLINFLLKIATIHKLARRMLYVFASIGRFSFTSRNTIYMHLYLFDNKHCFHHLEEVQALHVPIFTRWFHPNPPPPSHVTQPTAFSAQSSPLKTSTYPAGKFLRTLLRGFS